MLMTSMGFFNITITDKWCYQIP